MGTISVFHALTLGTIKPIAQDSGRDSVSKIMLKSFKYMSFILGKESLISSFRIEFSPVYLLFFKLFNAVFNSFSEMAYFVPYMGHLDF